MDPPIAVAVIRAAAEQPKNSRRRRRQTVAPVPCKFVIESPPCLLRLRACAASRAQRRPDAVCFGRLPINSAFFPVTESGCPALPRAWTSHTPQILCQRSLRSHLADKIRHLVPGSSQIIVLARISEKDQERSFLTKTSSLRNPLN